MRVSQESVWGDDGDLGGGLDLTVVTGVILGTFRWGRATMGR